MAQGDVHTERDGGVDARVRAEAGDARVEVAPPLQRDALVVGGRALTEGDDLRQARHL